MRMKKKILLMILCIVLFGLLGTGCFLKDEKPDTKDMIDVKITHVIEHREYDKARFFVVTTLPDGAKMEVRLFNKENGFDQKENIEIVGGDAKTGIFPQEGTTLAPGTYTVEIRLLDPRFQSQEFLDVVGEDYEKLKGDVVQSEGDKKTIMAKDTFEVE